MNLAYAIGVCVALASCSIRPPLSSNAPSPTPGRIAANRDVQDPRARYLGQVAAYIGNTFNADKEIVASFQSSKDIKETIITTAENEKRDYYAIGKPPPFDGYRQLHSKLESVHGKHAQAFTAYLKVFANPTGKQVDRGNELLKQAILELDEARKLSEQLMARDVSR
jgi:hypothetical protein